MVYIVTYYTKSMQMHAIKTGVHYLQYRDATNAIKFSMNVTSINVFSYNFLIVRWLLHVLRFFSVEK